MPTDTARGWTDAVKFPLVVAAWSLGLFGLLRLSWTEAHVVLPLTRVQGRLAAGLLGTPALPVEVTLACSGADTLALCVGAVLAFPVRWRTRVAGAAGGIALILALNTLRIGALGRAAASPAFNTLHVYVWPAVLTLAVAGYVFAWMRLADRQATRHEQPAARPESAFIGHPRSRRRFVVLSGLFLVLFTAASPLYLQSGAVLGLAGFIARTAAVILGGIGVSAQASGNVLWTPRGGFLVTQECISTPLIPVYLAAVCAYASTPRRLLLGILATAPLFTALGIVRLLVVALPDALVASPLFLVHAFYQLLLAAVIVFLAALWRHGRKAAPARALLGVIVGVLAAHFLTPLYTALIAYPAAAPLDDPQGAIALLPPFQLGLYLAVWVAAYLAVGWRRFLVGLVVLGVMQTTALLALQALADYSGLAAQVRDIRGWAVAGPLLIVAAVVNVARPRR